MNIYILKYNYFECSRIFGATFNKEYAELVKADSDIPKDISIEEVELDIPFYSIKNYWEVFMSDTDYTENISLWALLVNTSEGEIDDSLIEYYQEEGYFHCITRFRVKDYTKEEAEVKAKELFTKFLNKYEPFERKEFTLIKDV